jgi:hypothetical protein
MIVYHGTGDYSLVPIIRNGPELRPRDYLKGRRAFSTTTDFEIASLFALRRSPPGVLTDERLAGVVIEYEVAWIASRGKDWQPAVCPGVLQDEKEIAIFNPKMLQFLAVWYLEKGEWVRRDAGQRLRIFAQEKS